MSRNESDDISGFGKMTEEKQVEMQADDMAKLVFLNYVAELSTQMPSENDRRKSIESVLLSSLPVGARVEINARLNDYWDTIARAHEQLGWIAFNLGQS